MNQIETIQNGLRRALERASRSDDRELAGQLREEGRRLTFQLSGLVRLCRLHRAENSAFERPLAELTASLRQIVRMVGIVRLVSVEDQLYVNDVRLRASPQEQAIVDKLIGDFDRHEVGGITFFGALEPGALLALGMSLAGSAAEGDARGELNRTLVPLGMEASGRFRFHVEGTPTPERGAVDDAFQKAEAVLNTLGSRLDGTRQLSALPVRRAVIDLVESARREPARSAAEPLRHRRVSSNEHHLLSVCSLALLLGRALELPESELSDLGVVAMLHDIGIALPSKGEDSHPRSSARLLMQQRGFHEAKYRRLLAVMDHHRPFRPADGRRPGLFARILRIVDDYDVLVAGRSQQMAPMSPPAALKAMVAGGGSIYDPALLDLFIQALGAWPPGTLLELTDGRLAVSVSGGRDPERFNWPLVRVVEVRDGLATAREQIDLNEQKDRLKPRRAVDLAGLPAGAAMLEAAFGTAPRR